MGILDRFGGDRFLLFRLIFGDFLARFDGFGQLALLLGDGRLDGLNSLGLDLKVFGD